MAQSGEKLLLEARRISARSVVQNRDTSQRINRRGKRAIR